MTLSWIASNFKAIVTKGLELKVRILLFLQIRVIF